MDINHKLIEKELDRLVGETFSGATELEKRVVLENVAKTVMLVFSGYPVNVNRMTSEILHKYFCLVEGLNK